MTTLEERKATLHANRLSRQNSLIPQLSEIPTTDPLAPTESENLSPENEATQTRSFASLQAGLIVQAQQQMQIVQMQQEEQQAEHTRQEGIKKKRVAKSVLRRGLMFVLSALSAPVILLDVIVWTFTLGWLNLEMIYGKYFTKGKSRFVDPISWDPIPVAVDKEAIILQGFVVAADIAIGVALLVLTFGGFCLLHDYSMVTSSIGAAASIGASLAQGESGGLCLSGIISSALGF